MPPINSVRRIASLTEIRNAQNSASQRSRRGSPVRTDPSYLPTVSLNVGYLLQPTCYSDFLPVVSCQAA